VVEAGEGVQATGFLGPGGNLTGRGKEENVMDQSSALAQLAWLTADLFPTAGSTDADLEQAREVLARGLLQPGADATLAVAGLATPSAASPSAANLTTLDDLVARVSATPQTATPPQAFRRSVPANVLGNLALTPLAANGMQARSYGPFVDTLGALHWIDVFPLVQQTAITRGSAMAPFIVLPLATPSSGPIPSTLTVGAGSLWIAAQLLAPAAPVGGYVGIAISGGTLTFSAAASSTGGGLQVAATTTLTLTVTPEAAPGPTGGGDPGADGGAVVANTPAQVTFSFSAAGAQITAAQSASFTAYGNTIDLSWASSSPVYESLLGQILVPFTPQAADFAVAGILSNFFQLSGTARILGGAWALPVAVVAPAQLGSATTAGLLALVLEPGLKASWQGLTGGPASLGVLVLEGAGGMLALLGALYGTNRPSATIDLWFDAPSPSTARSSLELNFYGEQLLYYTSIADFAGATQIELLSCGVSIDAHIDRPSAADGSRIGPDVPGLVIISETASRNALLVVGVAPPETPPPSPIALALRNALLVTTPPSYLLVVGAFSASPAELNSGGLLLTFGLQTLLPTLPDPYAANFLPIRPRGVGVANDAPAEAISVLLAVVAWSPTTVVLGFVDTTLGLNSVRVEALAPTPAPPSSGDAAEEDGGWLDAMQEQLDVSIGSASPQLFMLDVSTNIDQFGVALALTQPYYGTLELAGSPLAIVGLDLVAPGLDMRVFTVPAIQWEPVVTVQNIHVKPSPFPSPAGFLDDGGPTLLGVNDVTLVPVAPAPLIDEVVTAYGSGKAGAALFTLPFGMTALADLPARPTHPTPLFRRASLTTVQPQFAAQNLSGGMQLSLTAPASFLKQSQVSPSLPGSTVQLRNLVDQNGNPLVDPSPGGVQLSVLGPAVDETFNSELAPGGKNPLVPVTRIDFSGYGASMFSAWNDPTAKPPAVVQSRFNVIVGRTSHEVVQVSCVEVPHGAIFVRTITIDRQDDTEVFRHDSGWLPVTPGRFELPGITIHPGAVVGAYNIREIKDTSQTYSGSGGLELVGVYFDADLKIDGIVSGANANGLVPSVGQFGFVQTAPANTELTAAQLSDLITSVGPLGGPVNCVISVGGTAQTMRVSRVEVDNAPHPGAAETHEFAVATRGSPSLPQPGAWSVVERTDTVSEPSPIDPDLGVSLIRQGAAGTAPGATPWRIAEPVDLWTPDSPSMDYCLLHTTDSTRMLFPRPVVASGASAFTSDQIPSLADGFALMSATSICPRQDSCLAFPNNNYALQIGGDGAFTLTDVPATFAPSIPKRVMSTCSAGTIGFEYADPSGAAAAVSASITPTAWAVGLTGVNVRVDIAPFDGIMRMTGNYQATSAGGVNFEKGGLVLGSVLTPLQDLLSFLTELGLPNPVAMAFSNAGSTSSTSYKLSAGIAFSLPSPLLPALTPLLTTPLGSLALSMKTGVGNTNTSSSAMTTSTSQWSYYFTFSGNVQVPVFPLVKAGGLVGFGLTINFPAGSIKGSEQISFQAGVIATVGGSIVPGVVSLQGSVSFAFMLVITLGPSPAIGVGCQLTIGVSGQLLSGLLGISFTAQATGVVTVTSPQSVQATFGVSIDITLCWFLDISFSETFQYTESL
jgi:hypothetical protein